MKVRDARADDLSALLPLRCALWPHLDIGNHEPILRRRFDSAARFATMVLVDSDGQLCGFVDLMRDLAMPGGPNRVALQAIFVAPPMRRRGGATQLLEAAQRWAHGRGAGSLYCDLPIDDDRARDMLGVLGFAEAESWIRTTRAVSVPLEVTSPAAQQIQAESPRADEQLVVIEKARSPLALIVNIAVFLAAVLAFANTDIFSNDPVRGMLMPLLDLGFVLYFSFLFVSMRYRKRADSNARADQLFRIDD